MTSEVMGVLGAPMELAGIGSVPRTYVRLLQDRSLTLETQDRMIANLEPCDVVDLDAGHMAMITQPEALAALLNTQ
jgi:hypothetical protein